MQDFLVGDVAEDHSASDARLLADGFGVDLDDGDLETGGGEPVGDNAADGAEACDHNAAAGVFRFGAVVGVRRGDDRLAERCGMKTEKPAMYLARAIMLGVTSRETKTIPMMTALTRSVSLAEEVLFRGHAAMTRLNSPAWASETATTPATMGGQPSSHARRRS